MIQEDKNLLLQDLCARLPFGICSNLLNHHLASHKYIIHDINIQNGWTTGLLDCAGRIQIYSAKVEDIKPYLRSMSSVTEEEEKELIDHFCNHRYAQYFDVCNKYHIDYRGLIEKGLAIEVTKDNNPYKD